MDAKTLVAKLKKENDKLAKNLKSYNKIMDKSDDPKFEDLLTMNLDQRETIENNIHNISLEIHEADMAVFNRLKDIRKEIKETSDKLRNLQSTEEKLERELRTLMYKK